MKASAGISALVATLDALTPNEMIGGFKTVETTLEPSSPASVLASFRVDHGVPKLIRT